jgi:hypothetical protein
VAKPSNDGIAKSAKWRYWQIRPGDRRHLTDAEIVRCIEVLDRRKQRGGDHKSAKFQEKSKAPDGAIDKTSQETARAIGISPSKVERARTVL